MPKVNSCRKGKAAERALCEELRRWNKPDGSPVEARRGQQHKGGADSPDIIHNLPAFIECKSVKAMDIGTKLLDDALKQAIRDENRYNIGSSACVMWRKYRGPWMVTERYPTSLKGFCPMTCTLRDWLLSAGYTERREQ